MLLEPLIGPTEGIHNFWCQDRIVNVSSACPTMLSLLKELHNTLLVPQARPRPSQKLPDITKLLSKPLKTASMGPIDVC